MARQVLDNGVILPSEYSDDWYDDMTSNLTKLDEVIGSDAEKLSASDVGAAAISNDYDDLDDKPAYNILRRASVTLTAGGTGNYTDLDSDSKIKAGDYVLDAANKLYSITAVDEANSTYTVSAAAIINITDKSELGAAALSNSYDDLSNLPGYGILRFCSTAITDNSSVAFANISSVSKIAAGDFLLDTAGKMYLIASIDSVNETAAVTTPLTQLAVDSGVLHKSGNETKSGELTVTKVLTNNLQAENSSLTLQSRGTNRSCAMFNGSSASDGGGFWCYGKDSSNGSDCRLQIYNTSKSRYERIDLVNSQFLPSPSGELDCGGSSNKWKSINGINPGSLSLPDLNNGIDISGYLSTGSATNDSYTALANGYIGVIYASSSAGGCYVYNYTDGVFIRSNSITDSTYTNVCGCFIPILKNQTLNISTRATESIVSAKFFPCQGNV